MTRVTGEVNLVRDRCPAHYARPEHFDLLHSWALAKQRNALPVAGGLDDQAAVWLDASELCESWLAEWQEEQRAAAEARMKAKHATAT